MIIIPSLKTVVLLIPRTGSGTLYRAILNKHPDAMMLYRHMTAAGIPVGYVDHYQVVATIRHPIRRIWSLYNYVKKLVRDNRNGTSKWNVAPTLLDKLEESVSVDFETYILSNEVTFPHPDEDAETLYPDPYRMTINSVAENLKSQFDYVWSLDKDKNRRVRTYKFEDELKDLYGRLKLGRVQVENESGAPAEIPLMSRSTIRILSGRYKWEIDQGYDFAGYANNPVYREF